MSIAQQTKKYLISRFQPSGQPAPLVRIGKHITPSLSLEDARTLVSELQEVLGDAPIAQTAEEVEPSASE